MALALIDGAVFYERLSEIVIVVIGPIDTTAIKSTNKRVKRIVRKVPGCRYESASRDGLKRLASLTCCIRERLIPCVR
jgi:hypothetical protein